MFDRLLVYFVYASGLSVWIKMQQFYRAFPPTGKINRRQQQNKKPTITVATTNVRPLHSRGMGGAQHSLWSSALMPKRWASWVLPQALIESVTECAFEDWCAFEVCTELKSYWLTYSPYSVTRPQDHKPSAGVPSSGNNKDVCRAKHRGGRAQ